MDKIIVSCVRGLGRHYGEKNNLVRRVNYQLRAVGGNHQERMLLFLTAIDSIYVG